MAGSTGTVARHGFMEQKEPGDLFGLGVFHKDAVGVVGLPAYNGECVKVVEIEHARILGRGVLNRYIAFARGNLNAKIFFEVTFSY